MRSNWGSVNWKSFFGTRFPSQVSPSQSSHRGGDHLIDWSVNWILTKHLVRTKDSMVDIYKYVCFPAIIGSRCKLCKLTFNWITLGVGHLPDLDSSSYWQQHYCCWKQDLIFFDHCDTGKLHRGHRASIKRVLSTSSISCQTHPMMPFQNHEACEKRKPMKVPLWLNFYWKPVKVFSWLNFHWKPPFHWETVLSHWIPPTILFPMLLFPAMTKERNVLLYYKL